MSRPPPPSGPYDPAAIPAVLGEEINGPGKQFFDNLLFDNILDAILELSAAVWTQQDRIHVLETILARQGIPVTEAIEAHLPDADELAERAALRAAFVDRVFSSFVRRPVAGTIQTGD